MPAPTRRALATALLAASAPLAVPRARAAAPVLVLTGVAATFSIATRLAAGTAIAVQPAFPADIGMQDQAGWLTRRNRPAFQAAARQAQAVIALRSVWPADPVFPEVRRQNIRAVEIDAASSFQPELAGVATLRRPGGAVLPLVWLAPGNAIRMIDIVAADLRRLAPPDAEAIAANQAKLRGEVFALRTAAAAKLSDLDDPAAIALAPEAGYLLADLGIRVAARPARAEPDWSDQDRAALADQWAAAGTRAVVATQPPADATAALIARLGGRVALIDPLDPGQPAADGGPDPESLPRALRANLDALIAALTG